ncbi:unnamed protein product [Soboliphyme baturini]|uniref:Uncharacterized protein n=1 Tax=Soboliphyme baturini TaxID=241478 RepID=A0A183J8H0_9BILA|nr:unnamed protein product [Soboliphyme baturini]
MTKFEQIHKKYNFLDKFSQKPNPTLSKEETIQVVIASHPLERPEKSRTLKEEAHMNGNGVKSHGGPVSRDLEYDQLVDSAKEMLSRKAPRRLPAEVVDSLISTTKKGRGKDVLSDEDSPYKKWEVEEYDWETDYQTGPETFLLQLRDPNLAGRIRDYRLIMWFFVV